MKDKEYIDMEKIKKTKDENPYFKKGGKYFPFIPLS